MNKVGAAIKFFPLFEDASDEEIEHVAKHFEMMSLNKGDTLYKEADKADRMYFLYTGEVVLTSEDDHGLIMELTRVDETGALIGDEILFLNDKSRKCTVTGLKPTTLFSLSKKGFERFRHGLPSLAKNIEFAALQRERLHIISDKNPVFKGISKKRRHQLSTICRIVRFKPGQTIIQQGVEKNRRFYIIAGGHAAVYLDDTVVRELGEGDYFGEVGLVSGAPPTATVKVFGSAKCYCLTVSKEDFRALFTNEPSVLAEFSIRFLGTKVGLEHVLNHDLARESFLSFCSQEFASENVEFWKAVEDYERLGQRRERKSIIRALNVKVTDVKQKKKKLMVKRATDIIERWVVDDAEEEVSMASAVKDDLLTKYSKGEFSYDMFEQAKDLVFSIMKGDNFSRYKQSAEFAAVLKQLGQYETL